MNDNENMTKPIDVVVELSREFFSNNEGKDDFIIKKGLLGSKLNVGTTKTEALCKALEGEYGFIRNERGFITIDRLGFEDWMRLSDERQRLKEEAISQYHEHEALEKDIERLREAVKQNEGVLAKERDEKNRLQAEIDKINREKAEIPEKLKVLEEQKETAILEYKKKTEEYETNRKKTEETIAESRKQFEAHINSMDWLNRPTLREYYIDKTPFEKFLGETLRFCIYGIAFLIISSFL